MGKGALVANVQLTFTDRVQVSIWPDSTLELWEKGHDASAVHPRTLKNMQGTFERSWAAAC